MYSCLWRDAYSCDYYYSCDGRGKGEEQLLQLLLPFVIKNTIFINSPKLMSLKQNCVSPNLSSGKF